jgi:predicted 2-oxoglutarate/Fe(II)-dependent dioxygenase YbiX
MGQDFIVEKNFISAADCAMLVECFERNLQSMHASPYTDPYWNNRFIWIGALPTGERAAKRLMQDARRRAIGLLKDFYSETAELYSDTAQLVRWLPGWEMEPHADNMNTDGEPHGMPWRDYASVIYLNDDYDGGELYFPRIDVEMKPVAGTLVAFTGGEKHLHGVRKVGRRTRYTMPGWYTRDVSHRDPSSLEEF